MKFADELFAYYKNVLTANEEDIDLLVASVLQELNREDLLLILAELNYNELFKITGTFLSDELRKKMIKEQSEDIDEVKESDFLH